MKKRNFILTLLAIVATFGLFTSCNKTEKKIIGTWECTSGALIDAEEGEELDIVGSTFTFKDDNTVTIAMEGEGTLKGTFTVDGDEVVVTFSMTDEDMTVTTTMDMTIQEIDKSKMDVEGTMNMAFNGLTVDSSKFKASFKKK